MLTWRERAAKAIEDGYLPGNNWEDMLLKHLRANEPAKVKQLEEAGDLEAYVTTLVADAVEMNQRLRDDGTPPETAHELALEHLFPAQS